MKLEELMQTASEFKLATTGKNYTLRPFTLRDEIWLSNEFGGDLSDAFSPERFDFSIVCRIVFRLIADKTDFIEREVDDVDENGKEVSIMLGGYKLLSGMIRGEEEKVAVLNAMNVCIANSRPEYKEEDKKKVKKVKKQIGAK